MGRKREHEIQKGQGDHVPKAKAYSYLRFSTPEQALGDSRRRQIDLAVKYAAAHGLELDGRSYADLGVSAYRGRNAATGGLKQFLDAVEDRVISEGAYLLVENLDRITRNQIIPAQTLFLQILDAGITIVTLADQRSYSRESVNANPTDLIISILSMIRGNEESAMKAQRVRAAWDAKRKRATREPLTAKAPAWLRLDYNDKKSSHWTVLEERAEVVRRIFRMAEKGIGQETIAATLNKEAVPTFGRGKMWHRSFIKKLLDSDAVVGTFTPHTISHETSGKRVRTPGKPIPDYYPRVIDRELFENIRAMRLDGRRQPSTKGTRRPVHILSGIARCGRCGGSMTRVYKGRKGGKPKLVCMAAKVRAGCVYESVNVEDVERAISEDIEHVVGTAPVGDEHLDAALGQLELLRGAIADQLENVAQAIAIGGDSATLREQLRRLEAEREKRDKEHDMLLEKIATASRPSIERRLAELEGLVKSAADKAEINATLRQLLRAAIVDRKRGKLRFDWAHGGESELMFAWPSDGEP